METADFYTDESGYLHDVVKWHTRKKHEFIKLYLDIWVKNVKRNPPPLDIFDLFAASGLCYCPDAEQDDLRESTWKGSAILAADCLQNYAQGRTLFLNTYHQSAEACQNQRTNLTRLLSGHTKIKYIFESLPIEGAANSALEIVDPRYPNLWILDPCAASQLPWSVVEKIGGLRGTFPSKGGYRTRKPELIISFMTDGLQRNVDLNPHVIDTALGLSEDEWRPAYERLIDTGYNTRQALVNLYAERLAVLYEKPPIMVEINSTDERAIVYCMLLLTESNAGHYVFKKKLPEFNYWRITEWRRTAERIAAEKHLPPSQTKLTF